MKKLLLLFIFISSISFSQDQQDQPEQKECPVPISCTETIYRASYSLTVKENENLHAQVQQLTQMLLQEKQIRSKAQRKASFYKYLIDSIIEKFYDFIYWQDLSIQKLTREAGELEDKLLQEKE